MDNAYALLMQGAMVILGLCLAVCLYRAFRGPKTADRLVAVNMAGTVTIMLILLLALLKQEDYLLDVALIYALISFVSVLIFAAVYIKKQKEGP